MKRLDYFKPHEKNKQKNKADRSKGKPMFIVDVCPSKIKLDQLRNKRYLFN